MHAFGHAQPQLAGRPQRGHLAAPDARAKRAQPAKVRRVRIGAQDQLARQHDCLFAQHLVADAAAHLKEVANPLLGDKLADFGVVLRVLGRRRRHGVVERDRQPIGNQHPFLPKLLPDAADGGRVVVAQHHVRPRIHDLADLDLAQSLRHGPAPSGQRSAVCARNCCSQSPAS